MTHHVTTFATPRMRWDDLPAWVRDRIEEHAGGPVRNVEHLSGGFSPGLAALVDVDSGRRLFVKAVGTDPNPESPDLYLKEALITENLPPSPSVPPLLWWWKERGWIALGFDAVDGRQPTIPWDGDELGRVLEAVDNLHDEMTPAPVLAPDVTERFGDMFVGWRRFVEEPQLLTRIGDHWPAEELERLVGLESAWGEVARGETLLHADLRADNVVLADDRVFFIDWPWACRGARWVDVVMMLPSVALHGGGDPEALLASSRSGQSGDRESVDRVLAAWTGFLLRTGMDPPPSGLPRVRQFQRDQGQVALRWLRRRLEA